MGHDRTDDRFHAILARFALPGGSDRAWDVYPVVKEQGFSTARLWKLVPTADRIQADGASLESPSADDSATAVGSVQSTGAWCLRAWPQNDPIAARLPWIQQQVRLAAAHSPFILAPVALRSSAIWDAAPQVVDSLGDSGTTSSFLTTGPGSDRAQPFVWQVEPWAAGQNDFLLHPTPARLTEVMRALAQLHQVWIDQGRKVQTGEPSLRRDAAGRTYPSVGPSPGLSSRWEQLGWVRRESNDWLDQAIRDIQAWPPEREAEANGWRELLSQIDQESRVAGTSWEATLRQATQEAVPLGPVLADPWSDHWFFQGDALTAVIDYGGLRVDTAAADLSRSLTSLCGRHADLRAHALQAYQSRRSLTAGEQYALEAFDQSSRWLAPWHWLRWLFVERRITPSPPIRQRLERLIAGRPF